ncbi:hypothetical protein ABZV93_11480 [Actinopolymorpha sp. NPDC004070]|uniref:hypothetical protein n=1 Tax=Actinopolymorpha sp. NPDC004070 TaxID=3154548 RepID=UPI0033A1F51C
MHALFTGRLLPKAQVAQMTDTGKFGYGLGIFPVQVPCVPGGVVWGHDGAVFGYSAESSVRRTGSGRPPWAPTPGCSPTTVS